jgi:hypothetical protein
VDQECPSEVFQPRQRWEDRIKVTTNDRGTQASVRGKNIGACYSMACVRRGNNSPLRFLEHYTPWTRPVSSCAAQVVPRAVLQWNKAKKDEVEATTGEAVTNPGPVGDGGQGGSPAPRDDV